MNTMTFVANATRLDCKRDDESMWGHRGEEQRRRQGCRVATLRAEGDCGQGALRPLRSLRHRVEIQIHDDPEASRAANPPPSSYRPIGHAPVTYG